MPPAVWEEVVEQGQGRAGSQEVAEATRLEWIKVITPTNEELVRALKRELNEGEAEAIALALEHNSEVLLIDESEARRIASIYQINKTGVIGVLMRATREGKIEVTFREELDRLRQDAGFWISDDLYHEALRAMGDHPTDF